MLYDENNLSVKILTVYRFKWDAHVRTVSPRPFHALSFRISGNVEFTREESSITSHKGDVTYVPAGCGYEAEYGDCDVIAIHFDADRYSADEIESYSFEHTGRMEKLFFKALDASRSTSYGAHYEVTSAFYAILAELRRHSEEKQAPASFSSFERAVKYMQESFTDPSIGVDMLARMACMSGTYFRRIFASRFADTPSRYITRLRMIKAEELLSTGRYSVEDVSSLCGYRDPKYFCRVVKSFYGCPPSALFKF